MAISLTTDGLNLDYRTSVQYSVSGTYPIGTVIVTDRTLTFPGTWLRVSLKNDSSDYTSSLTKTSLSIRVL